MLPIAPYLTQAKAAENLFARFDKHLAASAVVVALPGIEMTVVRGLYLQCKWGCIVYFYNRWFTCGAAGFCRHIITA